MADLYVIVKCSNVVRSQEESARQFLLEVSLPSDTFFKDNRNENTVKAGSRKSMEGYSDI